MFASVTTNRALTERVSEANDFHIDIKATVDFGAGTISNKMWDQVREDLIQLLREELDSATSEVKNRFHELYPGKPVTVKSSGDI